MNINSSIAKLVKYGLDTGLLPQEEAIYATNQILEVLRLDEYQEPSVVEEEINLEQVLGEILDYAYEKGLFAENSVVYRDLFDTKLMNCLMPRPSQVTAEFWKRYEKSPEEATAYYYKLSQDSNYIRRYRVSRDRKWPLLVPQVPVRLLSQTS